MAKCNCVYEEFCSMLNGADILLPTPCDYRKDSTDFAEVVRCRDCKQYKKEWVMDRRRKEKGYWFCYCDEHENHYPKADDFCSLGERREGE